MILTILGKQKMIEWKLLIGKSNTKNRMKRREKYEKSTKTLNICDKWQVLQHESEWRSTIKILVCALPLYLVSRFCHDEVNFNCTGRLAMALVEATNMAKHNKATARIILARIRFRVSRLANWMSRDSILSRHLYVNLEEIKS